MLEYLDKLRKKPRHVRERIALLTTAAFSLLIGGIWWTSWSVDQVTQDARVSKDISPIDAVLNIAKRTKDSTSDLILGLMDPQQYDASGTAAVAQALGSLDNEKTADIVYPQDIMDNSIHTDNPPEATTTSTTTE